MWKYRGFTLIEMLITIGIMAVISAGAMAAIGQGPRQSARDADRKSDLAQIQSALEIYRSDNSGYPPCTAPDVSCLITGAVGLSTNYLSVAPADPVSGRAYRYRPMNSAGGDCDGTASNRCLRYAICSSLERAPTPPADANCTNAGSCGVSCSFSLIGP